MDKKEEIKNQIEFAEESIEFYKRKVKESEEEKSELEAELEELEKQEEQEWKPKINEDYYSIDTDTIEIINSLWRNDRWDNGRLQHKIVFKTRKEAEEYLEYLKAKEKAMNEFSKEEWEDEKIYKYYINYDCELKKFYTSYEWDIRRINSIFFRTKESAQEFIDKYEKFLRRELGV